MSPELAPERRARILRECAVDLIRASDLADANDFTAVDSAARRVRHVIAELEIVAPQLRCRAQWLERLWTTRTKKELAA